VKTGSPTYIVAQRVLGGSINWAWERVVRWGAIGPMHGRGRRFARFGARSMIAFPASVIYGEQRIEIGEGTTIGPLSTLSAGMPAQMHDDGDPIITIGDRCTLGKGIGIVAHERVVFGDDVWTGHFVYVTDQNHGYEDVTMPIGTQLWKNDPVEIGSGSWLGHGAVILPGTRLGRHVVVAAGAVVSGDVPDFSVVAGVPAHVVRRYVDGEGWVRVAPDDYPRGGNGS
jgi:acetyltransferase-like isoleucine patch superfamily enzyme